MALKRCTLVLFLAAAWASAEQPAISGRWMGYVGLMLHTWQFQQDGAFVHVWVSSGSGNKLLRQERGTFRVEGEAMELAIASTTAGFVAPDASAKAAAAEAAAKPKGVEMRRVKFKVVEPGRCIIVDGTRLQSGQS